MHLDDAAIGKTELLPEKFLNRRKKAGRFQIKVLSKDFHEMNATWEDLGKLRSYKKLLDDLARRVAGKSIVQSP